MSHSPPSGYRGTLSPPHTGSHDICNQTQGERKGKDVCVCVCVCGGVEVYVEVCVEVCLGSLYLYVSLRASLCASLSRKVWDVFLSTLVAAQNVTVCRFSGPQIAL